MHKHLSSKNIFNIIGLMSGTSLDGLDLAHVQITLLDDEKWSYKFIYTETFEYNKVWKQKLATAPTSSALELAKLDKEIAEFYAEKVNHYLGEKNLNRNNIDFIASHGQTIFHQPEKGFTTQIGCGQTLSTLTNIKVINDFRSKDVSLSGQGAPLVPIGDHLLLKGKADAYLNLGGFSNISVQRENKILAFDISPANLVLNEIIANFNQEYDNNGEIGRTCDFNTTLLEKLNNLPYYTMSYPKSLGSEWLNDVFYPILNTTEDNKIKLGTAYQHIALQISKTLNNLQVKSVFITGGGAKNSFLIDLIKQSYTGKIVIPEEQMIDFKEALIFGFLGVLKNLGKNNSLAEVTGAKRDSSGGVIYLP